jgi:MFS family permease
MLSDLRVTDDPSKIGFYSGLVESSYAFTQLLSIWQWSKLSDVVGRRQVVLSGTLGVVVTTLVFGLSDSLFLVLLFRGLGKLRPRLYSPDFNKANDRRDFRGQYCCISRHFGRNH